MPSSFVITKDGNKPGLKRVGSDKCRYKIQVDNISKNFSEGWGVELKSLTVTVSPAIDITIVEIPYQQ